MFFGSLQKSGDSCQFQSIIRIQLFQSMAVGFIKSTIVIRSSTFLLKSHQNDLESRWSLLSLVYKSRKASNHKIIKVRSEYVSVFFSVVFILEFCIVRSLLLAHSKHSLMTNEFMSQPIQCVSVVPYVIAVLSQIPCSFAIMSHNYTHTFTFTPPLLKYQLFIKCQLII